MLEGLHIQACKKFLWPDGVPVPLQLWSKQAHHRLHAGKPMRNVATLCSRRMSGGNLSMAWHGSRLAECRSI